MILAGIVLYNPERERLLENVKRIITQVDKIILIDNASKNIKEITNTVRTMYQNIDIIYNQENKGIAYALNQILEYAYENKFDWFLTLDQDSIVIGELIKKYNNYINIENIAMISCEYEDLNANLPKINFKNKEYIEVDKCITSAAYCNTRILKEIGGFDIKMFIDYVDFDICATIRENNYKIIKINYKGFLHEIGKSEIKSFLGRKIILYNHSSNRVYYYVRNGLYFARKHKKHINVLKIYISLLKRIFIILFFENHKKENFKNIKKAIKDSKRM